VLAAAVQPSLTIVKGPVQPLLELPLAILFAAAGGEEDFSDALLFTGTSV